jgi:arylsulfatase A-like enzyme
VAFGSWDTHFENFPAVRGLSATLDAGWATLLIDLEERGLLNTTLVLWMGEFGRTPQINAQAGRDHFPSAWTTVLGGGGIKGGQVVGKTSPDGVRVVERPVPVHDFMATVCRALGLNPTKQNRSNVGRPIRLADAGAKPIAEVLA